MANETDPELTSPETTFTWNEHAMIVATRRVQADETLFVGVGRPGDVAFSTLQLLDPPPHILYESGALEPNITAPPQSVADAEVAESATALVSVPEIFNYWVQGGHISCAILGAAQIDRSANLNTTVIGSYNHPTTRLPGAGGAPTIAAFSKRVVVIADLTKRTFVDTVDFVSTSLRTKEAHTVDAASASSIATVVTDKCVMELDDTSTELVVTKIYAGITRQEIVDQVGWPLSFSNAVEEEPALTEKEEWTIIHWRRANEGGPMTLGGKP